MKKKTAQASAASTRLSRNQSNSFNVKDCAIIRRMGGVDPAINLRELKEGLIACPIESLYFHFCETLITPTFDNPDYRNDFAIWAAVNLRDRVLAERLGIINPYSFTDLEELREKTIETVDDRLSQLQYIPAVPKGQDFIFMRAVTVVFDTRITLKQPLDLKKYLPLMSTSTIYYHFLEARRRTPDRIDDLTFWLQFFPEKPMHLIDALSSIDFYFLSLNELKNELIRVVNQAI